MYARYGHFKDVFVKKGDFVKKGQKIGTLGTGNGQWSGHLHADFPVKELSPWISYVFGMTKKAVSELYSDPKKYRPDWYDHMGWGYLELATYGTKKCYHPGEDWNGKGAGNADVGTIIEAPFDGEVVYCYSGVGKNSGWGKLLVIKESKISTTSILKVSEPISTGPKVEVVPETKPEANTTTLNPNETYTSATASQPLSNGWVDISPDVPRETKKPLFQAVLEWIISKLSH